jgi:hypothetical protein
MTYNIDDRTWWLIRSEVYGRVNNNLMYAVSTHYSSTYPELLDNSIATFIFESVRQEYKEHMHEPTFSL